MNRRPDQDHLLEHNVDGIQEYDNPLPRWWVTIFYVTIVYAVLYGLNVPGIGSGKGRIASYEREMATLRAKQAAAAPAGGPVSEEALLAIVHDPAQLAAGKATFTTTCAPCHRADGGGQIGPDLTDDYWIHGGRPQQILNTVTSGVPDKGMPAWGQVLGPGQIPGVVAYVISLRGTHPPNPKEPQGTKEEPAPPPAP